MNCRDITVFYIDTVFTISRNSQVDLQFKDLPDYIVALALGFAYYQYTGGGI